MTKSLWLSEELEGGAGEREVEGGVLLAEVLVLYAGGGRGIR